MERHKGATQRADLLAEDLSIPALNEQGEEQYIQVPNAVDYEQLEEEQDEEYNVRLYIDGKVFRVLSIDLDF